MRFRRLRAVPAYTLSLLAGSALACRPAPPTAAGGAAPGGAAATPAAESDAVTVRRVWAGPEVSFDGGPTPDGRRLVFTDAGSGNLAVRDVATGEWRPLTSASWEDDEFGESAVVSPDGRLVAYAWFRKGAYELRVVGIDGTDVRSVFRDEANVTYVEPTSWSPDGRLVLLTVTRTDDSSQLLLVPADGGIARTLRSFDWRWPGDAAFSPDGRFVAYTSPPDERSPDRDIFLLSLEDNREQNVTRSSLNEHQLDWLPDGSGILFVGQSGAAEDFWKLPLVDGRPAGAPILVKRDAWRVSAIGFSSDTYFFGVTVEQGQVYTAPLDPESGRLLAAPVPVSDLARSRASSPAWSPDGSRLAWVEQSAPASARGQRIMVRAETSGEVREVTTDLEYIVGFQWGTDLRTLYASASREGRHGLYRIDLETGAAEPLLLASPQGGSVFPPAVSPDGRTLFFRRDDDFDASATGLVAWGLASGSERMLHRGKIGGMTLSPDGRRLAFVPWGDPREARGLVVLSPDGSGEGHASEIVRLDGPDLFGVLGPFAWLPDGRRLLGVTRRDGAGESELRLVDLSGAGDGEVTDPMDSLPLVEMKYIRTVRVSADGRRIAFMAGEFRGEVWVMEGLVGGGAPRTEGTRPWRR